MEPIPPEIVTHLRHREGNFNITFSWPEPIIPLDETRVLGEVAAGSLIVRLELTEDMMLRYTRIDMLGASQSAEVDTAPLIGTQHWAVFTEWSPTSLAVRVGDAAMPGLGLLSSDDPDLYA